jgi:hypothetical protein
VSKFVLTNCRIFAGAVDLTSNANKVELSSEVEDKETTTFGSAGWKEFLGGLASTKIAAEGQWEAGDTTKVDDDQFANIGTVGGWSIIPAAASSTIAVGDLAYLTTALRQKYQLGGAVGDVAPWTCAASGTTKLVRGAVLHVPGTARTATGTGSSFQLGATSATQKLYAALHVYSIAGTASPTLTVKVQSDNATGFPSAADVITFTAATAVGGQFSTAAGAITDDWYRVSWTISGTNPSFLFLVTVGIA